MSTEYVRTNEELAYQRAYEAKEQARHTSTQLVVGGDPVLELFGDGRVVYRGRLLVSDKELVKALYEIAKGAPGR
jgi:hypothetical protein